MSASASLEALALDVSGCEREEIYQMIDKDVRKLTLRLPDHNLALDLCYLEAFDELTIDMGARMKSFFSLEEGPKTLKGASSYASIGWFPVLSELILDGPVFTEGQELRNFQEYFETWEEMGAPVDWPGTGHRSSDRRVHPVDPQSRGTGS